MAQAADPRARGAAGLMPSCGCSGTTRTMTDLIVAACRDRLSMRPGAARLRWAGGRARRGARRADAPRRQRRGRRAASCSSTGWPTPSCRVDSPRFLSFIPAAPTKASLLFDMFVSCSSLHGTSWLEAAGVVVAENQALRVLADLAGMPPRRPAGCFVAGGSAGNLSALVVARDTAAHRARRPTPGPVAVPERDAHSSVRNALHDARHGRVVVPDEGPPPDRRPI